MQHRRFRNFTRASVSLGLLAASASGGQAALTWTGGTLGSSVSYKLTGDAGQLYYLLPSFGQGPTPLGIIDPLDPRVLNVGIDLLSAAKVGVLFGGAGTVTYPLPLDASLNDLPLYAQFITLPGSPTLADEISNQAAFRLALPGSSHYTLTTSVKARQGHTVTALANGKVLVAGGDEPDGNGNITPLDSYEIYEPANQSSVAGTSLLQAARSTHTATVLADGRVLLLGGYDSTLVVKATGEIFNPATGTTSAVAPMSVARTQHTSTLLSDGRVFVAGGSSKFDLSDVLGSLAEATKKTEVYDPANNSWTPGPDLPKPLIGHASSLLVNGLVLITGGVEINVVFGFPIPAIVNTCHRYDPITNAYVTSPPTPNLPAKRVYHGQIALADGTALVVGGADGDFTLLTFFTLSSCVKYSSGTNVFTSVGSLNFPRAYPSLINLGSSLVIADGLATVNVTSGSGTPEQHFEKTTTAVSAWTTAGSMLKPREVGRSAPINSGSRVVTIGTAIVSGPPADKTAETFAP